jgi:hypothetical protein
VRSQLRATGDEESDLIASYILAAQQEIETHCERALCVAKYELVLPRFPSNAVVTSKRLPFECDQYRDVPGSVISLEMPPVLKVASIQYYDGSNVSQTYTTHDLCLKTEPAELRQELDEVWPSTYSRWDAVTITFWAGHVIPIELDDDDDVFVSTTGYPFANNDTLVISKSGNVNEFVGDVAVLPSGVSANTTYHVINVSGSRFQIASSSGGSAVTLGAPTASGEAIDLLFAGKLDPMHRLILMNLAANSWSERCQSGECACNGDDFNNNPLLRKLKWRSPCEWV